MKNDKNFICISCFNDDLEWFKEFDYPHIIYDKCFEGIKKSKYYPYEILPSNLGKRYQGMNITNGQIGGYNINEYLTYIISNYDNLPEHIAFIKANIIKRHVSLSFFKRILDNKNFTSIEEWDRSNNRKIKLLNKSYFISKDGGWNELNNSWYLNKSKHPNKFFNNFNIFMNFIFKSYNNPKYIRFCPGANYIVPKKNILKYDLVFYKNLKYIINYSQLSGESHILERALYSIWNKEYLVADIMKSPLNEFTVFPKKENSLKANIRKLISKV
tara:strand:+ start:3652 stop:4467 length:816 start_codon:yes stop_codon:yes gene_type:complete